MKRGDYESSFWALAVMGWGGPLQESSLGNNKA
jgi:hypothetical protein